MLEKEQFEFVPKRLECVAKYEFLPSLTIHFSSQSDKYSIIYSHLKIKFFRRKTENSQEFLEIQQLLKNLKISCNGWNMKSHWNTRNYLSNYKLFRSSSSHGDDRQWQKRLRIGLV